MGFVNWLMKGIGFEGDENDELDDERALEKRRRKEEKKREKLARKQEKQAEALLKKQKDDENASFVETKNLSETAAQQSIPSYSYNPDGYNMQPSGYSSEYGANSMNGYGSKNVVFYNPTSYSEVQRLIDYLKQGESVMLNLDAVSDAEAQRMLDFSSGAVYALNGCVQRVQGNVFLLTPEGLNIVMPKQQPGQNE